MGRIPSLRSGASQTCFAMMCINARVASNNKRLERTRHERASLVSCVGEPLKRSVGWLFLPMNLFLKSWLRIVIYYWVFVSVIFFLDLTHLHSDWATLPSAIVTLPLSAIVITIGIVAIRTFGRNAVINVYFFEYGFMISAFLNGFLFYPIYLLRKNRNFRNMPLPPPPPNKSLDASGGGVFRKIIGPADVE
jgi:hypothetical protein